MSTPAQYPPPAYPQRAVPGTNSLAIGSFVVMFFLPPLAILLGVLAGREIRRTGEDGAGFARIAVIGGIVLTVLYTLAIVTMVLMFVQFFDAVENADTWLPDQD